MRMRSGDGSQNVGQARLMNRRWGRICVVFTMLLGLTVLSALSTRPNLLADTSTTTPTESPSDATAQPPADEPTPCESARQTLAQAEYSLQLAMLQTQVANEVFNSAIATLIAVGGDPNATQAQKDAAQEAFKRAQEGYNQALAAQAAAQATVDAAKAAVRAICGPEPLPPIADPVTAEPNPVAPSAEPCCGG